MNKTGTRISLPILRWATKTDYDCEVGSLSSRESWEQLKSGESKALSTSWPVRLTVRTPGFHPGNRGSIPLQASNIGEKKVNFFSKNRLQMQKNVL